MVTRLWGCLILLFILAGCTAPALAPSLPGDFYRQQVQQLLPADVLLIGEQHDAPDHQRIHHAVVEVLAGQGQLAALALEMAGAGQSTAQLDTQASEDAVRTALQWDNEAWPWSAYRPAVMAAVRAGVPVLGANLPAARLKPSMGDVRLDGLLPGPALQTQQQNIRIGHCKLLPESQISPMTRVQIARDVSMAQILTSNALPGKTVVLLAGHGHVDRSLGVPQHLPANLRTKTVYLGTDQAQGATENKADFDQHWPAQPAPEIDYCADFATHQATRTSTPSPTPAP